MPTQSKWQSLPTEKINPASLAIDKVPVRDIVDLVINEDRKVLAAVQREQREDRARHRNHRAGAAGRAGG